MTISGTDNGNSDIIIFPRVVQNSSCSDTAAPAAAVAVVSKVYNYNELCISGRYRNHTNLPVRGRYGVHRYRPKRVRMRESTMYDVIIYFTRLFFQYHSRFYKKKKNVPEHKCSF